MVENSHGIKHTLVVTCRMDGPDYGPVVEAQFFDCSKAMQRYGVMVDQLREQIKAGTHHVELVANIDAPGLKDVQT